MTERTATIASRVGLPARPAAIFANAAGELDI
jgi:phosphocarrier protein